jgi:hypothetical protein
MLRSCFSTASRRVGAGLLCFLAACSGSDRPTPVENLPVATVSVTLSASQLITGATATAAASVRSSNGGLLSGRPVTWQSSNPAAATVAGSGASATVTAVAPGTATISATSEGVTGTSATLTISAPPSALTDLVVTPTTVTLADPGATQVITTTPSAASAASVSYANATGSPAVATVTATGANPTITAVGKGTTTITINATGSGTGLTTSSLARTVTVTVPAVATAQVTLAKTGLLPNGTTQATATLRSTNGTALANRQITWTSSNTAIATVSGTGSTVTVTGVSTGTTTISATSEGVTAPAQTLLVQPVSACVELAADANTLALYHFNEGSGQTAANSAGGGRNGVLGPDLTTNRDPAWITDGKFGSALRFTRTGDQATSQYVDVANAAVTLPTNQASVEMYVRPRAPYAHSNLFVAGFINFAVNINASGGIEFGIGNGTAWHIVNAETPNLNDGNWHHLAATYNGTTMRVFFDGQERLAVASSTVLANPNDFKIGGRPQNTFLNGDLDEMRVSSVARTLAEILTRYCP